MNCDSVAKLIPLYFYGELLPEEEDRVEAHLHECTACAREMDRQRAMAAAFDERRLEAAPVLLRECRADLLAAIEGGAPRAAKTEKNPWTLFLEAIGFTLHSMGSYRQPVAAMALMAIGFFAARFTGVWAPLQVGSGGAVTTAGLGGDNVFSTVRSVQPDASGHVQIVLDETRRRVVSGGMNDQNIQRFLLAGAHQDDTAVRMEAVDLLKDRCSGSVEIRDVLVNALHDSNVGVRLKALEGLKPLAADPQVRKALAQVLLADENPEVRMRAVDMLVSHRDDAMVGVLQSLVQHEDNGYVRLKCEKALKEMNASIGTF
jgi:anti-sigma factor RsiW